MRGILFPFFLSLIFSIPSLGQDYYDSTYVKVAINEKSEMYSEDFYYLDKLEQPISYQYECIGLVPDSMGRFPQEGILQLVNVQDSIWRLEAVIIEDCSNIDDFFPRIEEQGDTLNIDWLPVGYLTKIEYYSGDTLIILEYISSSISYEDCYCAYHANLEFYTEDIDTLLINGKNLSKLDNPFITYEVEYFLYQNDTIGYSDKYGRTQGSRFIRKTKSGNYIKSIYKDGKIIRHEAASPDGQLLISEKDLSLLFEKLKVFEENHQKKEY